MSVFAQKLSLQSRISTYTHYDLILLLAISILPLSATNAIEPLKEQVLYQRGWWGYNTFRIPALFETQSGVLLAFAEGRVNSASDTGNIDMVLRRSLDSGRTWLPYQVVWSDQ